MSDDFSFQRFETAEQLVRELRERSDDIESITIAVPKEMLLSGPRGQGQRVANICGSIRLCSGASQLIHREDLERLLNDGILARMKIPISLVPLSELQ